MARRMWFLSLLTLVLVSLGIFAIKSFGKEEKLDKKQDVAAISGKIDEVLKNQQDIIKRLEDIRTQQDIIRVRASRR